MYIILATIKNGWRTLRAKDLYMPGAVSYNNCFSSESADRFEGATWGAIRLPRGPGSLMKKKIKIKMLTRAPMWQTLSISHFWANICFSISFNGIFFCRLKNITYLEWDAPLSCKLHRISERMSVWVRIAVWSFNWDKMYIAVRWLKNLTQNYKWVKMWQNLFYQKPYQN